MFIRVMSSVTGLFNVAHENTRGSMDSHFPRLGQMIVDYDHPIRKMTEEFIPLGKVSSPTITVTLSLRLRTVCLIFGDM